MSKHVTSGRRALKGDVWHDDNGPIPGTPADWQPPMTDAEIIAAAQSDPDNPPLTDAQLERMQPVSEVKRLRWSMKLSQVEFASQFGICACTVTDENASVINSKKIKRYQRKYTLAAPVELRAERTSIQFM